MIVKKSATRCLLSKVATGLQGFDEISRGGLPRNRTTLAGKFAESACQRGERTLFVSFDEGGERIQRNPTSVGIHLGKHVKSGLLRMYSGRTDVSHQRCEGAAPWHVNERRQTSV